MKSCGATPLPRTADPLCSCIWKRRIAQNRNACRGHKVRGDIGNTLDLEWLFGPSLRRRQRFSTRCGPHEKTIVPIKLPHLRGSARNTCAGQRPPAHLSAPHELWPETLHLHILVLVDRRLRQSLALDLAHWPPEKKRPQTYKTPPTAQNIGYAVQLPVACSSRVDNFTKPTCGPQAF